MFISCIVSLLLYTSHLRGQNKGLDHVAELCGSKIKFCFGHEAPCENLLTDWTLFRKSEELDMQARLQFCLLSPSFTLFNHSGGTLSAASTNDDGRMIIWGSKILCSIFGFVFWLGALYRNNYAAFVSKYWWQVTHRLLPLSIIHWSRVLTEKMAVLVVPDQTPPSAGTLPENFWVLGKSAGSIPMGTEITCLASEMGKRVPSSRAFQRNFVRWSSKSSLLLDLCFNSSRAYL